jgi:plasmid maintenance system killer
MIISFKDKDTEKVFCGEYCRRIPSDIQRRAQIKLTLLNAASCLEVMKVPPSNRLEKLRGNRSAEWSIRINDQWRITFKYNQIQKNFYDVLIEDYH